MRLRWREWKGWGEETLVILVARVGSRFSSAVKQLESMDGNRLKMRRDVVDATKWSEDWDSV